MENLTEVLSKTGDEKTFESEFFTGGEKKKSTILWDLMTFEQMI